MESSIRPLISNLFPLIFSHTYTVILTDTQSQIFLPREKITGPYLMTYREFRLDSQGGNVQANEMFKIHFYLVLELVSDLPRQEDSKPGPLRLSASLNECTSNLRNSQRRMFKESYKGRLPPPEYQ